MQESFGYSVLDLSSPTNPTALYYHDVRFPVDGPNSIPQHGDGQNMVQTISVSPDGARSAFSTTGPAAPFDTVVAAPDASPGFSLAGDFFPDRANTTVVQHVGSRYIAYAVHGSLVTASDVTTLPGALTPLSVASEATGWPGGYLATLAGNYLVYMAGGSVQVVNATSPGPAGAITAGMPHTSVTAADFGGRSIAYATAEVDPADPSKLWILAELNAASGENSPSYGLLSLNAALVKTSAGPIWRVPAVAGENWWANPGASSALISANGTLYALMWGQRAAPTPLYRLFSTTTAWGPPGTFDIPSPPSSFSPGQPMRGFSSGSNMYAYLPTGPGAFVIAMVCR